MLTESALYERTWKNYPELAKLLDRRTPGVGWTGPTSVSDNIFSQIDRQLNLFALVSESESEIKKAINHNPHSPIRDELLQLSDQLKKISRKFDEASHLSAQIARCE